LKLLFDNFVKDLPDVPSFNCFRLKDINPLGLTEKTRFIQAPNESMRILHDRLIKYLRKLKVEFPFATGAGPKDSPVKNVTLHRKNRYFYLTDIENAYSSVNGEKLASILCSLDSRLADQEKEVLNFLQKYCLTPQGGLITGAPASPDLFNIYTGILLDRLLEGLCRTFSLTYTRYLDDLIFSSAKVSIGKRKRRAIRKLIGVSGFKVSHRKSRVYDLKKGPITINGVGLELGGRIFLPRHFLKKIRGLLHRAMAKGDVNPSVINGMMGVFCDLTDKRNLNRTEQQILKQYRAYRAWLKWGIKPN